VDQELADAAKYAPGICYALTRSPNWELVSVNRYVFTWSTNLPNFTQIRFETTEP